MVIELFLIGVGLSMDAFAVSVCKGLGMEKINKKHAFLIGLYFGGFQALMPFLGWALGIRFQKYITSVDHWIAFFLLLFIGGKMVIEAVRDKDVQEIGAKDLPLDHKEMHRSTTKTCSFWLLPPVSMHLQSVLHLPF